MNMRLPLVFVISSIILSISYGYPHTEKSNDKREVVKETDQSFEDAVAHPSEHQTEASFSHLVQDDPSFYPSFSPFQDPPLGHSRPFYFQQQEGAYSQRAVSPFQQQLSYDTYHGGGGDKYVANEESRSYGLLGSGNFGVISGGTFYNDNEGDTSGFENQFENVYQNGHGAPSLIFGKLAKASRAQQQEPFANFRDFADINTPSYSQYVVVYTNKNSGTHEVSSDSKRPKNIIEQLAMLDQENGTTTSSPEKKLSKSKRKLALVLPAKKNKTNHVKKELTLSSDLGEPLLALS